MLQNPLESFLIDVKHKTLILTNKHKICLHNNSGNRESKRFTVFHFIIGQTVILMDEITDKISKYYFGVHQILLEILVLSASFHFDKPQSIITLQICYLELILAIEICGRAAWRHNLDMLYIRAGHHDWNNSGRHEVARRPVSLRGSFRMSPQVSQT